jgi:peptide/nickel transport system substrate-binding protein
MLDGWGGKYLVKRALPVLALAVGLGLAGSAEAAKDTLVIGVSQFPPSLHPSIEPLVIKAYIDGFGLRMLSSWNREWKVACFLCTELPTLENGKAKVVDLTDGKKGMEVTFTLQPKATWADGVPVTTKDVVFSWETGKRTDLGYSNPDHFAHISQIEVIDDKTFVMHIDQPEFDYNVQSDFVILPEHVEKPILEGLANKADYGKQSAYNREPTVAGLWNGPYKLTEFQSGAYVVFEPNPYWYGPKPAFKRITLKVIENTAALEANLLSGDIDYISGELGLTFDQALALRKRAADKYNFIFKPGLNYEHIDFNLDNPLLKDKRVREALLMAVDRQSMVKRLFEGEQPVADTWVSKEDAGYDPKVKRYPFDPKAAKALLDEAGFKSGSDGIRADAQGNRLSFEIVSTAGNRVRELVEQVIQSQFKDIGVELAIKNEPARTLFGETFKKRAYTGLGLYAWQTSPQQAPIVTLRSDNIPSAANGFAGSNYPGWNNPEMDKLITNLRAELDGEKRQEMWAKMQALYTEELPVLPLYFRADVFVIPKALKGIVPTGHVRPTSDWVEEWHWE